VAHKPRKRRLDYGSNPDHVTLGLGYNIILHKIKSYPTTPVAQGMTPQLTIVHLPFVYQKELCRITSLGRSMHSTECDYHCTSSRVLHKCAFSPLCRHLHHLQHSICSTHSINHGNIDLYNTNLV